jgi:hypothetical protein
VLRILRANAKQNEQSPPDFSAGPCANRNFGPAHSLHNGAHSLLIYRAVV